MGTSPRYATERDFLRPWEEVTTGLARMCGLSRLLGPATCSKAGDVSASAKEFTFPIGRVFKPYFQLLDLELGNWEYLYSSSDFQIQANIDRYLQIVAVSIPKGNPSGKSQTSRTKIPLGKKPYWVFPTPANLRLASERKIRALQRAGKIGIPIPLSEHPFTRIPCRKKITCEQECHCCKSFGDSWDHKAEKTFWHYGHTKYDPRGIPALVCEITPSESEPKRLCGSDLCRK